VKHSVDLTFEELALLDGRVNEKAQRVIDNSKEAHRIKTESGLSDTEAAMTQKIILSARDQLRLTFHYENIARCPCCGRSDGYWPVRRTTKYKRKGEPDYDNPKLIRACSVNPGFVTVRHHISLGWCPSCEDRVKPAVLSALKDDQIEVSQLLTGVPPKFKRHQNRECECGWKGHEGEMKWETALMGNGTFPSRCPQCGAGGIFNSSVKIADGYSIVPIDPD
jgi:hypothetical protein